MLPYHPLQHVALVLAGLKAAAPRNPVPVVNRLDRRIHRVAAERRRLIDLYQAGLVDLKRRATEAESRQQQLVHQRQALADQQAALVADNRLRQRITAFAQQVTAAIDDLDFDQRQRLLRLVVEEVRVTGWNVEIRLRIPLDDPPYGG